LEKRRIVHIRKSFLDEDGVWHYILNSLNLHSSSNILMKPQILQVFWNYFFFHRHSGTLWFSLFSLKFNIFPFSASILTFSTQNHLIERVERRWISLTSGRNPRSSIRTSASTCFFRLNLKTKHVDFIHSFACQWHVYYTKYYNDRSQ
jgi:hypothetical protein